MTDSVNRRLTPSDDEWEAEFDPTYYEKTMKGGVWDGLSDDEIVLLQIKEFKDDEHEENQREQDELAAKRLDNC
ncbi:hypothetical protein [Pseudomonas asgharzadehiana]|uniref:Uncharacterized protein n=1 Tax=Pseudomonas asgharzadehiana TaxID=2842349 RepID=A0ABX8P618_9PSED|nr:hypothetical protein [Pseudomonas asgharzadehiana]QXH69389.1 hypothetical protein KSS96_10860 [Pseudomonas asgharzadehiana]